MTMRRLLLVGLLAMAACGDEEIRGQIVVGLTSNMPIPKDISYLSVQVKQSGVPRYDNLIEIGENRQPLPARFTIARGKNPGDQVNIKIAAWQRFTLRQVREVITTIPASRVAYLPIELQWFCDGKVKPLERPANFSLDSDNVSSSCDEGETCIDGVCVDAKVDSETLADFSPDDLMAPPGADACFDTAACFASASQVLGVRRSDCTMDRIEGGRGINVAIETTGDGYCTEGGRCFVPLDGFSASGWTMLADGRLQLSKGACDAANTKIAGIAVTTACATKTSSVPTCPVMRN